jgi:hypothetical protein
MAARSMSSIATVMPYRDIRMDYRGHPVATGAGGGTGLEPWDHIVSAMERLSGNRFPHDEYPYGQARTSTRLKLS